MGTRYRQGTSHVVKSVKVAQSCLTFCDPMDCTPPGSSILEVLQARILEWVAISFFRGSSWPRDQTPISCAAGRFFTVWATREAQSYKVPEVSFDSNQLKKGFGLVTLNLPCLRIIWKDLMENAMLLGVKVKMHTECHHSPGTGEIVGGDAKDYPTLSLLSGCFYHRVTKVHFYLLNPKMFS